MGAAEDELYRRNLEQVAQAAKEARDSGSVNVPNPRSGN